MQAIPRQLQGVAVHDALPLIAENCFESQPNLPLAADQVKGSQEFYRFYRILKPGSPDKRMVDSGLDKLKQCDLEVILPHGKGRLERTGVKANQRVIITQP